MIVQLPSFTPTSGYRPVVWVFATFETLANGPITTAKFTIDLNGAQVAIDTASPFAVLGAGPLFTYLFKIDVQSIFQRLKGTTSALTNIFGTLGQQYNADATDAYGTIQVEAEYFYRSSTTGLPVSQGFTDLTTNWPVFEATRQHEQNMSLDAYVPDPASLAPSLFLTDSPTVQDICLNDSLFINTIHGDANFMRVTTYDGSSGTGAVVDEAFLVFPASGFNSQVALGIGPEEIRATTFTSGTVNIDNPLVKSYRITVGQGSGPFIPLSESKFYNVVDCCQDEFFRLHFHNLLGGTDAYTFKSLNTKNYKVTSDTAQKPLNWDITTPTNPHSITDRGAFRINIRAVIARQLETTPLQRDVAEWLTQLLSTPNAYLETAQGLLPVVIEDLDTDYTTNTDQELPLLRFSITAQDANERIIQRN
jgi:hypothetical protein